MLVRLFKKESTYIDKNDGKEKKATRFYLECGNSLVPIEPTYFEDPNTGKDAQYASRKAVMKAFAEDLPTKEGNAHGDKG